MQKSILKKGLFLLKVLLIFSAKLINTPCCINKLLLAGIEWVRCVRNFQFYQGVFLTVFPNSGFSGGSG